MSRIRPTREEIAAAKAVEECRQSGHDIPETTVLEVTETTTGED